MSRSISSKVLADGVGRLVVAGWFAYAALLQGRFLTDALSRDEALTEPVIASLIAHAALVMFLVTVAALALFRHPPIGKAVGFGPRVMGFAGTFATVAFVFLPIRDFSVTTAIVSAALIAIGNLSAFAVVLRLGRSFSIMPEARRLVTDGPYALVRHPLYLAEEIAVIGVSLQFELLPALALLVIHAGMQFQRMLNEEVVLSAAFPDYRDYAARTGRIIPAMRGWTIRRPAKAPPISPHVAAV